MTAASLVLDGCADMHDVQAFASESSAVTASEPIISSWPTAYVLAERRAKRISRLTTLCRLPPESDWYGAVKEQMDAAAPDAAVASNAAAVLALYMDTLAKLAGDEVSDTSEQRASLQGSIGDLAGGPAKSAAGALLAVLDFGMDGWRRKKVAGLIKDADPPVQLLTAYLGRVTRAVAAAETAAGRINDMYWERSGCSADEGTRTLLLEREASDDAAVDALRAKADAATKAYSKIAADHAVLAANTGKLTKAEVKAILKRDLPILTSALKAFDGSAK